MLSSAGILYIYGYWLTLPLTCLAAFRWGFMAERVASILFLVALVATILVHSAYAKPFLQVELGVVVIDLLLLGALITVAVRSPRGWLIWASSFHAIASLGHLAKLVRPEMSRLAYGLMEGASGWPVLLALIWGILQCRRIRRSAANTS